MSRIVRDPRCSKHPCYTVYAYWGPPYIVQKWACTACHRPLGIASFTSDGAIVFPQGRREVPHEMRWNATDWDWLLVQEEKALRCVPPSTGEAKETKRDE